MLYWEGARTQKNQHLDTRALAEGMRIQAVWHLGGVRADVSDEYLGLQAGELDWIRVAIRAWNLEATWRCVPLAVPERGALPNVAIVENAWFEDQAVFFADRRKGKARTARSFAHAKKWFLRITLGSAAMVLVATILDGFPFGADPHTQWTWFFKPVEITETWVWQGLTAFGLVAWGLLVRHSEVCAFEEEAHSYVRMTALFRDALARLEAIRSLSGAERTPTYLALLTDAGREALQENRDWLLLHRDRQISPYA